MHLYRREQGAKSSPSLSLSFSLSLPSNLPLGVQEPDNVAVGVSSTALPLAFFFSVGALKAARPEIDGYVMVAVTVIRYPLL